MPRAVPAESGKGEDIGWLRLYLEVIRKSE